MQLLNSVQNVNSNVFNEMLEEILLGKLAPFRFFIISCHFILNYLLYI